jgi:ABC-2 type transport system permease protein
MDDAARRLTGEAPSALRAWFYLVWLSWQRQMRARQMVWIALALLVFAAVFVSILTALGVWNPNFRRWEWGKTPPLTAADRADVIQGVFWAVPFGAGATPRENPVIEAWELVLSLPSLQVHRFVNTVVFVLFLNFLLPLWTMSFATEAIGGDREGNSLVWLLTRPLPRPAIYLGKFVAMLPWTVALTLGGLGLLCLLGGAPGRETFRLLWPSALCGALAFSSLFLLIGAFFRRPAIVSIVYTFFLETILGNMPGYLKRVSLNFYTKCMMYDALKPHGFKPSRPEIFLAVDAATACLVLLAATAAFLALGMYWFARKEYHEIS